jgi:hypothetical protein
VGAPRRPADLLAVDDVEQQLHAGLPVHDDREGGAAVDQELADQRRRHDPVVLVAVRPALLLQVADGAQVQLAVGHGSPASLSTSTPPSYPPHAPRSPD